MRALVIVSALIIGLLAPTESQAFSRHPVKTLKTTIAARRAKVKPAEPKPTPVVEPVKPFPKPAVKDGFTERTEAKIGKPRVIVIDTTPGLVPAERPMNGGPEDSPAEYDHGFGGRLRDRLFSRRHHPDYSPDSSPHNPNHPSLNPSVKPDKLPENKKPTDKLPAPKPKP